MSTRGAQMVVWALLLGACAVDNPVRLDLSDPDPLRCVDDESRPLVERALARPDDDVWYVFDLVRTATPDRMCDPLAIASGCGGSSACEVLPEERRCVRAARAHVEEVVRARGLEDLSPADFLEPGEVALWQDAPDGAILVRLALQLDGGFGDPCASPGLTAPRRELLLGCAFSCPQNLRGTTSTIEVGIPRTIVGCDLSFVVPCATLGVP